MWPFKKQTSPPLQEDTISYIAKGVEGSGISTRTVSALAGDGFGSAANHKSKLDEETTYTTSDLVYTSVAYIRKQISQIRFIPKDVKITKSETTITPTKNKALQLLFSGSPNPYQTWTELLTMISDGINLYGNGYIIMEKVGSTIEFWGIQDPRLIEIIVDSNGLPETYRFNKDFDYTREQVIHIKSPIIGTMLYGLSPLAPLFDQLSIESYATADINDFYRNSLVSTSLLTSEQPLTKKQAKDLTETLSNEYEIKKGRHKLIVLPNNLSIKGLRLTPKEALLLDSLNISQDRVYSAFGLHKMLVGGNIESYTHNLQQLMDVQFATAIRPLALQITDAIESFIQRVFKQPGFKLEPDFENIPEVKLARMVHMEAARTLYVSGLASLNESREILGLPRIEGTELADQNHLPSFLIGSDLNTIQNLDASRIKTIQEQHKAQQEGNKASPSTTDNLGGKNTGKEDKQ